MATTTYYGNLVNYLCMPTENDHYGDGYGGVGAGRIPTELTLLPLLKGLGGCNGFITSGFAPPSSGTLIGDIIACTVTAGSAVISGCRIVGTSSVTINLEKSATNWILLKLELDGSGKVYRPVFHVESGTSMPTIPSNAIYIGKCVCGASSITSTKDLRYCNRLATGCIDHNASTPVIGNAGTNNWTWGQDGGTATITFKEDYLATPMVMLYSRAESTGSVTWLTYTISTSSLVFSTAEDNSYYFVVHG